MFRLCYDTVQKRRGQRGPRRMKEHPSRLSRMGSGCRVRRAAAFCCLLISPSSRLGYISSSPGATFLIAVARLTWLFRLVLGGWFHALPPDGPAAHARSVLLARRRPRVARCPRGWPPRARSNALQPLERLAAVPPGFAVPAGSRSARVARRWRRWHKAACSPVHMQLADGLPAVIARACIQS